MVGGIRRILAAMLVLAGVHAGLAGADPAPIDGMLFPIGGLTATGISPVTLQLSWQDRAVAETGFQIQYQTDPYAADQDWIDVGGIVPPRAPNAPAGGIRKVVVTIPGALPAATTIYYFRVRTTITHGTLVDPTVDLVNGPWTPVDPAILGPQPPSSISASLVGGNVELTWANNFGADPLIVNNHVYRAQGTAAFSSTPYAILTPGTTIFTDTGVSGGNTYRYVVHAVRETTLAVGTTTPERSSSIGSPSTGASVFIPIPPVPPSLPSAPTSLAATAIDSTRIGLTWTDTATNESGFVIERSTDGGTAYAVRATIATMNLAGYTDVGLFPGYQYHYRVRAFNNDGQSAPSNVAAATTPSLPPPVWVSPNGAKQNEVQVYECEIRGTANYSAGVRDILIFVTDTVSGSTITLPYAPVSSTTNEWSLDWHTYEFKPGRYHLKGYSHALVGSNHYFSGPANVLGWTVPADSAPCPVTNP